MGLSAEKASEMTDIIGQDENLYLKKNEENVSYYSSIYSLKKICSRKSYIAGTKIRTVFIRVGLCPGGGAYTWSNKSVNEKVGLSFSEMVNDAEKS